MIDYKYYHNPWWEEKSAIEKDELIVKFEQQKYQYWPSKVLDLPLKLGDIHLVTGPRQTGKSTAMKLYIRRLLHANFSPQAIFFFNCDVLSSIQDIIDIILDYCRSGDLGRTVIFLDEISSVENWPQAIKWLVDSGFMKKATVFLTGSSSIALKKSGEFLPGRRGKGKDVAFLPISFREFLELHHLEWRKRGPKTFIQIEKYFEKFLLYGGFLRNINDGMIESANFYLPTLRSDLFKAKKKEDFLREVIRKILNSLSSQTSYTNIAEEAELGSKNTAIDYLNFLSDSFYLKEIKFFDIDQKKIILKKNKKYYTADPFIIWLFTSFVTGNTDFYLMERRSIGQIERSKIIENFIASELYKNNREFYYFQKGRELDFYLPKEKVAIEIKYKEKITGDDLRPLQMVSKRTKKYLITKDIYKKIGDINLIPAHLFIVDEYL